MTQVNVPEITLATLLARIEALETKVAELNKTTNASTREMKDEDAKRILTGDLKDKKHNECAETLGLSYGQIYSCRGEYTFRHIHKVLREQGFKNPWKK